MLKGFRPPSKRVFLAAGSHRFPAATQHLVPRLRCSSSSLADRDRPPFADRVAAQPLEGDTNLSWGANLRGLGHNNYLGKILNARVYDVARETPLQPAPMLSVQIGNTVHIKREDLQPVFSFKIRGAYNMISQLSPEQLKKGIVACSAGNHAQGVAMPAAHLGADAVIVMPKGTPAIKVNGVYVRRASNPGLPRAAASWRPS